MSNPHTAGSERLDRALSLVAAGLHDRAGELLAECVRHEPASREFVEALLSNLKQLRNRPVTTAAELLQQLDHDLAVAQREKRWDDVVALALRRLTLARPTPIPLLALAEAAAARRQYEIEVRYAEAAAAYGPDDPEVVRRLATIATREGRFEEAISLWQHVEELVPADSHPARMVARLVIDRSRCQAGMETKVCEPPVAAASADDEQCDLPAVKTDDGAWQLPCELPHLTAEIKRTPIQQLELAVREYPANGELYLQLASLYLAKGRDYDAERLLLKGREEVPDDLRVRNMWEDVSMLRANSRVAAAQQQFEADGTPVSRAALAEARTKRDRQEIEIYQQRVKRDPDNAKLQYQLGLRLKKSGKLLDAAKRFEAASSDPTERPAAAFGLGECLQQSGQLAESLRAYRQAAEAAVSPTQLDWRKRALYQAAELSRRAKLFRRARRYTQDLLRLDPHDHRAASLLAELEPPRTT